MLKKIGVEKVRQGMYIQEICANWMDHPFWKSKFLLEEPKDLNALKQSGVREVWIDISKGLDVEIVKREEAQAPEPKPVAQAVIQVPIHEELGRAKAIRNKAKEAVTSMFQEVRMGKALHPGDAAGLVDDITLSVTRNPSALLSLVRLKNKDDYTYLHSVAVCALMVALGRQLGLEADALKSAGIAGLFHDVGKMMIPEEVLNKPGKLTDEEFSVIRTHPERGWEILKASREVDDVALDVCRHHHERVDGKGYPDGLSGDLLTLFARMGAVCDVYDAITSERCYKAGWDPADAIRKMAQWQEGQFDAAVFKAFVKTVGIYPAGTLVRLKSMRLAIVTEQTARSLLKPIVKVIFSIRANGPLQPELVDLSKIHDEISGVEDPEKWKIDPLVLAGI